MQGPAEPVVREAPATARAGDLHPVVAGRDLPPLGGRPRAGRAAPAAGHPPGPVRGPHVRRPGALPDGRRDPRPRPRPALRRLLPRDQRPRLLRRRDRSERRGLPEPRRRAGRGRAVRCGCSSGRRTAGPGCASTARATRSPTSPGPRARRPAGQPGRRTPGASREAPPRSTTSSPPAGARTYPAPTGHRFVPNQHPPWQLQHAEVVELDDGLLAAVGLPGVSSRPPDRVAFSHGVYAEFARPRRVES